MDEFFYLLDGHLLRAVYHKNNKGYRFINDIFLNIENADLNDEVEIEYNLVKKNHKTEQINLQENETSMNFFKRIINDQYLSFWQPEENQPKTFLFEHYWSLWGLIEIIYAELQSFFQNSKNKKWIKQYKDFQKVINKIKSFFINKLK